MRSYQFRILIASLPPLVEMLEEPVDAQAFVAPHSVASVLPEVEVYLFTLIITSLLREKLNNEAAYGATLLVDRIKRYGFTQYIHF